MTRRSAARRSRLRRAHLVLALLAGLPLQVLGVTGALLVFPGWLEEVSSGVDGRVEPTGRRLTPGEIVAAIDAALPDGDAAERVVFPATDAEVVTATTTGGRRVTVDPYRGTVLAVEDDPRATLHGVVLRLHVSLLAGEAGTWVTGGSALALCGLAASGLWLWRPAGRWTVDPFRVRLGKGARRFNFDLHRAGGFYASAFLVVIGLTGAAMAFHDQATAIVHWVTWSSPASRGPAVVPVREGAPRIPPDRAVAAAAERHPGWRLHRLYVPARPDRPYRVFLDPPAQFVARHQEARLVVDPYDGGVLHDDSPATRSRGDRAMMWVLPLHYGTFGGLPTRWLYLVVSLSPVVLAGTGLTLWWGRRRKQARARRSGGDVKCSPDTRPSRSGPARPRCPG